MSQIVWSGALEREAAERERRYLVTTERGSSTEAVYGYLRDHPESTMAEIAEALRYDLAIVNSALYMLKRKGRVCDGCRRVVTLHGRAARGYVLGSSQ